MQAQLRLNMFICESVCRTSAWGMVNRGSPGWFSQFLEHVGLALRMALDPSWHSPGQFKTFDSTISAGQGSPENHTMNHD
jgi:catalase (peroxidase I)